LAAAAALGAAALGASVGLMATSGWLISRASQMPPILALEVATVGVRFFGLARGVTRYAERLVSHDAAFRALGDVRVAVYERLERLAPQGLIDWRRGDLLARLGADVDATIDLPLRVVLPAAATAIVSVLTVAFVALLSPVLAVVVAVALVAAAVVLPLTAAAVAARAVRAEAPLRGELTAAVVDTLAGSADLLALGAAPAAVARSAELDNRLTAIAKRASWAMGATSGLAALIGGLALVAVLAAGVQQVSAGALAGVWFASIALITIASQEGAQGLPAAALAHSRVSASAERLIEVIDSPDPIAEPATPIALDRRASSATLELRGVSSGWRGGSPVLTGIDLDVGSGTRVAIIGASGSGKSTLAAVLLRFCEVTSGSYTVNGTDVREVASDDVRAVVGLCSQDAHIFDTTVRENLRLARPSATDSELLAVLSNVALEDWVRSLPQGLDTPVGEHGGRLSGGQRQRLALARSLLAEHDVLVLDEPTEHLDLATADRLIDDLVRLTRGRTTVLLTHRMRGVEAMDQVVVLEAGQIVERGTPSDLLADPDSRLSRMMLRERRIDSLEVRDERR
jgi:thiol reductant ABC exporter CydC subunit